MKAASRDLVPGRARGPLRALRDARRRASSASLVALLAIAAMAACRTRDRDHAPGQVAGEASSAAAPTPVGPTEPPSPTAPVSLPAAPLLPELPRGLPPLPSPSYNRTTAERVELGQLLFFDPRLSASGKTSCASCHQPERGWADGTQRARTDGGEVNLRHTPSLYGVGYAHQFGWDGGMPTLEAMIISHMRGQLGRSVAEVAGFAARSPGYAARLKRSFREREDDRLSENDPIHLAKALAAFARTLVSGDSPWDRHEADIAGAVSPDVVQGFEIFTRRAGCATCHPPPHYTDFSLHARPGAAASADADPGRMRVTANPADRGAFRTPGLRGLVATAPYFHDGSAATLEAAVDAELARDASVITPADRQRLLAFLRALDTPPPARPSLDLPALP